MARGVQRWSTVVDEQVVWWARVWIAPDQYIVVDKAEYEKKLYQPPFWQVQKQSRTFSKEVAAGMARLASDFAARVAPLGFARTKRRFYARETEHTVDSVYLHRGGSSYGGAPHHPSISIRVVLGIHALNHPSAGATIAVLSDHIRAADGKPYHNRFNAETWSAYDLCLDGLTRFTTEFAEPWFVQWREPKAMLDFPDLPARTRAVLEQAMTTPENPEHVAFALKACGIKKSKFGRDVAS